MKLNKTRFSKSMMAVLLSLCMLASCITAGVIPTDAAQLEGESVGWNNTTWYLGNDILNAWDKGASGATMTKSGNVQFYYDFYLLSTDTDVYYRPYEKDNYAMGPTAGPNTEVTTTGTAGAGYNDRCWKFVCSNLTANKYNRVRIWIDTSGNNGNGWSWYGATALDNIIPTVSLSNNSPIRGNAVTITAGKTNNGVGTLTYKYEVSSDGGENYTVLSNYKSGTTQSWTPTAAGTFKIRVTVKDGGVTAGTNARTAREESVTKDVTVANPTFNISVAAKTGGTVSTDGGTVSPTSFSNLTEVLQMKVKTKNEKS